MIKILNIITDMNIGGAGNVLMNFMRHTDREEFDHTVIVPANAQLAPLLRDIGVNVVESASIVEKSLHLGAIGALRKELKRLDPDVVHTHASLSARIAARFSGKKRAVIHTRHCVFPQGRLKTSFPMKQALGFLNNRLSDLIISVSPAAGQNLIDTGTNPKKIVTVYNGVEPRRRLSDDEKSAVRASLGITDGQFVCAIIARLVPEKGHVYVLDAAEMLRDLPIRIIIAGSGPVETRLRSDADGRGLSNCIFTGFVEDIAAIENIMDLQLNASYGTEATSLSLLEGMSLGVPAVVSDFGGNPFIISNGDNGIVVPQHDGKALATAVRELYDSPETLARMGEAALTSYKALYTAGKMAKNIEQVYRDAMRYTA